MGVMRAIRFHVTVPGFVVARSLGRVAEAFRFGPLGGVRLGEVRDPPSPPPGWARLEVLGCGICGSDLANLEYSASPILEPFASFPAVLGHEILARVESVGRGVRNLAPGQRVAVDPMISCRIRGVPDGDVCPSCRLGLPSTCEMAGEDGGHVFGDQPLGAGLVIGYHRDLPGGWGERILAHESQLFALDSGITNRAGVLLEPLSVGMHAALNATPGPDEDVLVIGSGPIALGTVWALRAVGFRGTIVAQTKRAAEAELALTLGATEVVSPGPTAREALVRTGARAYLPILGDEVFSGGGFPHVFDCVGSASSFAQALRFAAPRGRVVMLGCAGELRRTDLTLLWARELELRGFVGYGLEKWRGEELHTFEVTQRLLLETRAPVERLVTHVFPLEQYRHALSAAANRDRSGDVKVVLTPDEASFAAG
ncbi:MAG: alcohol dehydrogenase [Gemmatimonadetes bacterium]|nr:alcohol dehydrogenase [Gemmatimonadota bacterium]